MELNDYIRADMAALRKVAAGDETARQIHDVMADHRLVDYAARAMTEKLAVARARGRGGWWDANECSILFLRELLQDHIAKGDMRDVMNIAAMIYTREIADAPPPEICPNCDTALPGGCEGTFRDDGAHCRWNLQANVGDDWTTTAHCWPQNGGGTGRRWWSNRSTGYTALAPPFPARDSRYGIHPLFGSSGKRRKNASVSLISAISAPV